MKNLLSFLLLIYSTSVLAQLNGPESIDYHAASNRYFISNTTSGGSIKFRNPDGSIGTFISGISPAPYGIEVIGDTLYACCGGFIRGYDINTLQQVISINTGAGFLNGITHDNNGNIFTTDFTNKRIYRVKYLQNTSNLMVSGLTASPNGIIYDEPNNRCVFVNWGTNAKIMQLSLADSTVSVIQSTTYSNIDGIARDNNNNYYISSWGNNSIVRFANNFTVAPEDVATGMNKPADIFYNQLTDTLAVPNSGNNSITLLNFGVEPPPTVTICNEVPLQVYPDSIFFKTIGVSSFGDSAIHVTLFNSSEYSYAYPLAWYEFVTPLPPGITVHPNSQGFNVFASAWNTQTSAVSQCNMYVTQPIPDNYTVKFRLWLTNLDPAPVDTCYFTDTFSVVLKYPVIMNTHDLNMENKLFISQQGGTYTLVSNLNMNQVVISDLTGRTIQSYNLDNNNITFNLHNVATGVYFVQAYNLSGKPLGNPIKIVR